jgi:3-carboxy-cis,cis-muconate cycloisomerase
MPAAPADSALYRPLFGDDAIAQFFTDSAEIRAMVLVQGELALVQGRLGLIPAEAAAFIHRAAREVQIDPASLAAETAQNGVPVPGLIAAFRKATGNPEAMQYLHWGATSQDIMDTALALRLRRVMDLWEERLSKLLQRLATLAEAHADLPIAARTYGHNATPTSFGAVVAGWGWPLIGWQDALSALRQALLQVSLSGAAGTLSAMGEKGPQVRAELALALGLSDPGRSWHTDRSALAQLVGVLGGLAGSLGKIAEDLLLLSQSGLSEVTFIQSGASSTMPQKQNPIGPSVLLALSRHVIGLVPILQGAAVHRQQRDGAAWFTEWLTLPQICISAGRMLTLAYSVLNSLSPAPKAMRHQLNAGQGQIHAEALSFFLSEKMPRPEAQTLIKGLCTEAVLTNTPLMTLVRRNFPETDWEAWRARFALGQAPAEARAFAARFIERKSAVKLSNPLK